MTDPEYRTWQKIHADLFNLHTADDVRLFAMWEFSLKVFDFAELREASFAVAEDPSDKRRFRENHLAMLRDVVMGKRAEAAARERDRLDRMYADADCQDCSGVGLVRVPHPDWIVDGELERSFFLCVACLCPIGVARFNSINGRLIAAEVGHQLMDLSQYEAIVPDWRTIVAAHRETRARELDGAEFARKVDRIAPIDLATIRKPPQ